MVEAGKVTKSAAHFLGNAGRVQYSIGPMLTECAPTTTPRFGCLGVLDCTGSCRLQCYRRGKKQHRPYAEIRTEKRASAERLHLLYLSDLPSAWGMGGEREMGVNNAEEIRGPR